MQSLIDSLTHLRDLLNHHPLFTVGVLLTAGYFLGKLVSKIRLPEITGFIIAGLLLGRTVTGVVSHEMGESLTIVTETTLGLIALTIGGEFSWGKLKRLSREVMIITLVQLLATFGLVGMGLWIFGMDLPFALLLGAIASATAPAATVAIVHSLRAHGLFVDYLYGVVALDDAGCVILFGVILALAAGMLGVSGGHGGIIILHGFQEVLLSLAIGAVGGCLLHLITRRIDTRTEILIISVGILLVGTALSIVFHLSPLLTNMAAGAVLINLSIRNHRIFQTIEPMTPPIYALFFVIAGTELDPAIVQEKHILILGLLYILLRALGKYGGAFVGCALAGGSSRIKNYLGICMLPQAGVAIGLVLLLEASPMVSALAVEQQETIRDMVSIVLLSVFVNELVGPPLSKFAIIKGNEMEA